MIWPFKKRDEYETEMGSIPLTTLVRWYMFDAGVVEPNKVASYFDMTPVSEEGAEKEEQDSVRRVERVLPLFPYLAVHSEVNAKAISSLQRDELIEAGMDPDKLTNELDNMMNFYEQLGFTNLVTAFSAAAELGLITITGEFSELLGMEKE